MRLLFIILTITSLGCRTLQKKKGAEVCADLTQRVEKAALDDTAGLKGLNGKFVEVEGVFYDNFEDVALYPSASSSSSSDALWLKIVIPDSLLTRFVKKNVRVIGKVNVLRKGHEHAYLATLDSVFCIQEIVK